MNIGTVGVWSGELRFLRDRAAAAEAAAELEGLGYGALWVPGGTGTGIPIFTALGQLLAATQRVTVASAIISIWVESPAQVAEGQELLRQAHPGRFLLGLGISHARFLDEEAKRRLTRPVSVMRQYLDELDELVADDLSGERILAALRPKMLSLAGERSLGSHPYFVTPEHTAVARRALGPSALLAPEQAVVLERDPARAREIARAHMALYLELPNYVNNLRECGFGDVDLRDGGSDRLVDALVAWGDESVVAERFAAHRQAGADHVAIQVLSGRRELPLPEWRRLAATLCG
jgi:probable F420-dependent oxidoreductase